MNKHIQVIMHCAAKFPELRFGQFIDNVLVTQARITPAGLLYSIPDRDLAEHCKSYCKEHGR